MQTSCVRQGQIEIGIIEHEGRQFSALGATTIGRNVTGYTKFTGDEISLTTWGGQTTLASRSEVVRRYWAGAMAIIFRLPKSRWIAGYSLGEGMLFRGELLLNCDEIEARHNAEMISECFADIDAADKFVADE